MSGETSNSDPIGATETLCLAAASTWDPSGLKRAKSASYSPGGRTTARW